MISNANEKVRTPNKCLALCRRTETQSSTTKQLATVVPNLTERCSSEFCTNQLINFTNQQFRAGRFPNSATSPSPNVACYAHGHTLINL
jgi:hypothetical protein